MADYKRLDKDGLSYFVNKIKSKFVSKSGDTMTGNLNRTVGNGTVFLGNDVANIINSPLPKYVWHDVWAFCRACTPIYEQTTDGETWNEATLEKRLFSHQNTWGYQIAVNSSIIGSRWTFKDSFAYSSAPYLAIGVGYAPSFSAFSVKLEQSTDLETWFTLVDVKDIKNSQQPIFIKVNNATHNNLRLTITKDPDVEGQVPINALMLLSYRWGSQGKGEEFEHPYTWDANYNISPLSGAKFVGNLTGTASGNLTNVAYDSSNKKLTKTINGSTSNIITVEELKTALNISEVPSNGDIGQVLTKTSSGTAWQDPETGESGVELTQAEYDALSKEEKLNGTIYYITDGVGDERTLPAERVTYDNADSGLVSTTVQDALTEIGLVETFTPTLRSGFSLAESWGWINGFRVGNVCFVSVSGLKSSSALSIDTPAFDIPYTIKTSAICRSTDGSNSKQFQAYAAAANNYVSINGVSENQNMFFQLAFLIDLEAS